MKLIKLWHINAIWACFLAFFTIMTFAFAHNGTNGKAASSSQQPANSLPIATITPGRYSVMTRFLAGPKAGQSQQGTYDIRPDGALTVFLPYVGTGYGTIAQAGNTYILTFREMIPQVGEVQVTQVVTSITKNGFTSQGFGEFYVNGQPQQQGRNQATSVAVLV